VVSLLEARGLGFAYPGGERALQDVGLELERGELVCVLGPNGSGKSTLLKVLAGLLRAGSGEVRLEGGPIDALRPRERARRIASVPQVLAALPDADVESFVLGGRYPHLGAWGRARSGDHAAVARALEEADAARWRGRNLGELSGGECQRVLVARALAQEAELLLFDEPTSALDPGHQVRLFELIRSLVAEGRGALVATHELALAGCFADRLLLMDGGRVVAAGTPAQVLTPAHLEPTYGKDLHYGEAPVEPGGEHAPMGSPARRPLVVPWPGYVWGARQPPSGNG
jgi:iron complex transport system ATP-binding protein